MNYEILKKEDINLYIDHVLKNYKNSRNIDNLLLDKIKTIFDNPRMLVFVEKNLSGQIVASILTRKKIYDFQFLIINYRTNGEKIFNVRRWNSLFNFMFNFYEENGYYKWLVARPKNLLNQNFFENLKNNVPFNRYITAIECAPELQNIENTIYTELLSGIPELMNSTDFIIITGMCKQEFRKFFNSVDQYYLK